VGPMRAFVQGSSAPRTLIYAHRSLALEGQLERIGTCYRSPQKGVALRMIKMAPSKSPDALNHPTHNRLQSKRRAPPGLRLATPRQVHRPFARIEDLCDIDSRMDQHHHRSASIAKQHPSHLIRRPRTGHNILVSESHPHQGGFGH
jgi:hypothetical protein